MSDPDSSEPGWTVRYDPAYLIDVAKSARFPYREPDDGGSYFDAPAKDGWVVRVFYKASRFRYVDSLISPAGETIESSDVPVTRPHASGDFQTLLWWEPEERQFTEG
jgi:hypothetical protein